MGFLQRLFGRPAATAPRRAGAAPVASDPFLQDPSTQGALDTPHAVRRELVRICLRDTLHHNGIPSGWVRADPLTMVRAEGNSAGVHARLLVQHWEPRLMVYAVALQQYLERRIHALDPSADEWLVGVSWQFELPAGTPTPPLPHPGSWTSSGDADAFARTQVLPAAPTQGQADVISGPTRIGAGSTDGTARQRLERLMAERDDSFERGDEGTGFAATQPLRI